MIIAVIHHPQDCTAGDIVYAAMVRSFTKSQVKRETYHEINHLPEAAVLINPSNSKDKNLLF